MRTSKSCLIFIALALLLLIEQLLIEKRVAFLMHILKVVNNINIIYWKIFYSNTSTYESIGAETVRFSEKLLLRQRSSFENAYFGNKSLLSRKNAWRHLFFVSRTRLFCKYTISDPQPFMCQRAVLKKIFAELMLPQKKCSVLQD